MASSSSSPAIDTSSLPVVSSGVTTPTSLANYGDYPFCLFSGGNPSASTSLNPNIAPVPQPQAQPYQLNTASTGFPYPPTSPSTLPFFPTYPATPQIFPAVQPPSPYPTLTPPLNIKLFDSNYLLWKNQLLNHILAFDMESFINDSNSLFR